MSISKTKVAGWCLVAAAVFKAAADLLDGNGFDFSANFDAISAALTGAGLINLRSAVSKVSE